MRGLSTRPGEQRILARKTRDRPVTERLSLYTLMDVKRDPFLLAVLVGLFAVSGFARAQSSGLHSGQSEPAPAKVGGGYHCTVETGGEEFDVELAIFQNGTRLKGSVSGEAGEFELTGSVSGSTVTLMWSRPFGGKQIPFKLTGEFKDNTIQGTADLSSIGRGTFTAERFME